MSTVKFVNINKVYGNNFHAVYDFNLDVADKEFIVFVGPSGCGKSTTLRMIAGLEEVTDGEIYIDNVLINEVAPKDRNIAMVFQSYALYPHMTVFDNMAFSLMLRKEKFPVMRVDATNPDFLKEEEAINKEHEKELEEGIAQIEAESQDIPRKVRKEKIKDFCYRQDKKYKAQIDALKEKYSSQVMTYDHDAVKKLGDEIAELRKAEKVDEALISSKQEEIAKIKTVLNTPQFEFRHFTKEEMARKVSAAAETLGLEPYLKRKPAALSGGQRQRVALGRAIVRNPKVFLMDEPLSNLDAKLRVQMRSEIAKIHQRVGATTIYVTHDQTEAMTMATRIVCMKDGWVQQIGTPKELFNTPANMFVAGFIGAPAMNFIKGKYDGKEFTEENGVFSIGVGEDQKKKLKDYVGKNVILGVRPEDMYLAADKKGESYSNPIKLTCDISELLGRELVIYSYVGDQRIIIKVNTRDDIVGGNIENYVLDLTRIHFFDPETTNRIK